jgi:hypothetical protein
MPPLQTSAYCYGHDPEHAVDRDQSRRRGGLRRRRTGSTIATGGGTIALRNTGEVLGYLERTAADLSRSDAGVAKARAEVYLASTALKAIEVFELERRLIALEMQHSTRSGGSP